MNRRNLILATGLVIFAGCMPYRPGSTRVASGPTPTFKRPNATFCEPRKVLERTITLRGGDTLLKRLENVSFTGQGISAPQNQVASFRFRTISSLPDRMRDESDYEGGVKFVQVVNGDKGWYSINNDVKDKDAVSIREMRDQLYVNHLLTLVVLREARFTLEPLPDQRKEGVMVEGFVVKSKDQRDVSFYFEKENGLLLSIKSRLVDPNTYIEKDQETFFTNYVNMHGIQFPKRWIIYSDGNKSMELNIEEMKLLDKVDDVFFAKPKQ